MKIKVDSNYFWHTAEHLLQKKYPSPIHLSKTESFLRDEFGMIYVSTEFNNFGAKYNIIFEVVDERKYLLTKLKYGF